MSIRDVEKASIRSFLTANAKKFKGARVLDYGCGQQPYRELIERHGGTYRGFDRRVFPGSTVEEDVGTVNGRAADVVVCTQVIQYVPSPAALVNELAWCLDPEGKNILLMTGPGNWPEVEPGDLHRFTKAGIEALLLERFKDVWVTDRAGFTAEGEYWSLGWGAVAWL